MKNKQTSKNGVLHCAPVCAVKVLRRASVQVRPPRSTTLSTALHMTRSMKL